MTQSEFETLKTIIQASEECTRANYDAENPEKMDEPPNMDGLKDGENIIDLYIEFAKWVIYNVHDPNEIVNLEHSFWVEAEKVLVEPEEHAKEEETE